MNKVLLLLICITLSALSILTYDIFPEQGYNKSYDHLRIFGPGIFYSLFLVSYVKANLRKTILIYLLFVAIWITHFYGTFICWGVVTPIAGAISGYLIDRIINGQKINYRLRTDAYLLTGGISASVGFIFFYLTKFDTSNAFGFRLMWIIVCWQLAMGVLLIRNSR